MQPVEPALLLEHAQFIRALARSLVRDPGGADDIEQDTWLRALERAPREHVDLRAWLATVMKNLLRNKAREQNRRTQREERSAQSERVPSSVLAVERSDTLRALVGAVVELEEPYRSTLLSLYFEGLSANELASREGVPAATVRSHHQRALAQLRERLDRSRGSREAWSAGLAHLVGLESAGSGLPAAGLALAAGVAATLIVGGVWWTKSRSAELERSNPLAAAARGESSRARMGDAPDPPPTAAQRSEVNVGEIALLGAVEDFDPNDLASGARAASDAKVRVRLSNRDHAVLAEQELTVDDAGAFSWRVADPGARPLSFAVEALGAGLFQTARAHARLGSAEELSAHVSLRRKALADIALRVERSDGSPLAGLRLGLLQLDNTTRVESVSGDDGVVRFERSSNFGRFDLLAPGWAPIGFRAPREQPDGSWAPGALIAAASGSLSVRVVDERGAPLDDVDVLVSRQSWEYDLEAQQHWGGPMALGDQSSRVDSEGVANFESVVADTDLRVRVVRGRETLVAGERSAQGELLELGSDGFSIRVSPGATTTLVARWSRRIQLVLQLARSDGAPLELIELTVLDAGRANPGERIIHQSVTSRPSEPIRAELLAPRLVGPLVLFAREVRERDDRTTNSGLGYAGNTAEHSRALSVAWRTVLIGRPSADASARTIALSMMLEAAGSIRGVLLGRNGEPARRHRGGMGGVRVDIVPSGVSRVVAQTLLHPQTRVEYSGESQFAAHDLPPGRYDVLVAEQIESFYTFGVGEERFGPFEPDGSEQRLHLGDAGAVRVKLAVELDAPPADVRTVTLMASLQPREPAALDVASAQPRQRIDGLAPWPEGAPRNFTGIGGEQDRLGQWSYGLDSRRGVGPFELPPLGPGWYRFGVDVRGSAGPAFATAASSLAWYAPGEYELTLRPLRVSNLHGRVRRDPARLAALELVAEDGQRVHFRSAEQSGSSTTRAFVPSTGHVLLHDVPHGRYELRAGSPAQLERGEFSARVDVVVNDASEPFALELR